MTIELGIFFALVSMIVVPLVLLVIRETRKSKAKHRKQRNLFGGKAQRRQS